jgi:hypothetical protein
MHTETHSEVGAWAALEGGDDVTDEELARLALAADPDTTVDDDAVCLSDLGGFSEAGDGGLLPAWYMPGALAGVRLTGWRRTAALTIIVAFLLITAYGLCNTYGDMTLSHPL